MTHFETIKTREKAAKPVPDKGLCGFEGLNVIHANS
jgi:hypothetical protein